MPRIFLKSNNLNRRAFDAVICNFPKKPKTHFTLEMISCFQTPAAGDQETAFARLFNANNCITDTERSDKQVPVSTLLCINLLFNKLSVSLHLCAYIGIDWRLGKRNEVRKGFSKLT